MGQTTTSKEQSIIEALQFAANNGATVSFYRASANVLGVVVRKGGAHVTEGYKREFDSDDLARLLDPPGCSANFIIRKTMELRTNVTNAKPAAVRAAEETRRQAGAHQS